MERYGHLKLLLLSPSMFKVKVKVTLTRPPVKCGHADFADLRCPDWSNADEICG